MTVVSWNLQVASDLPVSDGWLSVLERSVLKTLRIEKRRRDWMLGRWTAKQALAAYLGVTSTEDNLSCMELIAGADGAPVARLNGAAAPVAVSISHCNGSAMCALAPSGCAVGCDLERSEAHSDAFVSDYFTEEEQRQIRGSLPCFSSVLWSAKESVLKLLHTGLRLDTRSVAISVSEVQDSHEWQRFRATFAAETTFHGWWREEAGLVRTVAAFPPPAAPPEFLRARRSDDAQHSNLPCGKIWAEQVCRTFVQR